MSNKQTYCPYCKQWVKVVDGIIERHIITLPDVTEAEVVCEGSGKEYENR